MNQIQDLLLTWDEYRSKQFSLPYIFTIENDHRQLVYFGAKHSFDINDKQFEMLERRWKLFLEDANSKKIVIKEGHDLPQLKGSLEDAVIKHGERGFIQHKADIAGIPTLSPDPTERDLWNELEKKFTKEEIFYYDVISLALQWNNTNKKVPFEAYIGSYIKDYDLEIGWNNFDFSLENVKRIHREIFKAEFDQDDKGFFYNHIDPSQTNSVFNELSRKADVVRDTEIVKAILKKWKEEYSVFIVFGSGHAIIQERAIQTLAI